MKATKIDKNDQDRDDKRQRESSKNDSWDDFLESLHMFPDDFMIERNQPTGYDRREPLFE